MAEELGIYVFCCIQTNEEKVLAPLSLKVKSVLFLPSIIKMLRW